MATRKRTAGAGAGKRDGAGRFRSLPSVDRVISHSMLDDARARLPHAVVAAAARAEVEATRQALARGEGLGVRGEGSRADPNPSPLTPNPYSLEEIAARAARRAWAMASPSLRPVINATGVVIHTNLGRAPLSPAALEAMERAARYSNLEYDLEAGERGSRYVHAADILRQVTGCEDALVVNNNAAGLVLVLAALAAGREVVLSRGQSVEIGGGFRIPDVMRQSGARLVEVGTTNRTYVRDYDEAITEQTAIVMRVHNSNFRIVGFTTSPAIEELAALAHERGVLLVDDVGSGALLDVTRYGLAAEPMVQESVRAGADLVLFSGDKLLGGPQCGVIVGRQEIVARLKKHPLARALRVDKLTLAALEATLLHYLKGEAESQVPVWRMISTGEEDLRQRATSWAARLSQAGVPCQVERGESAIGGGSLPGETLPTWVVALRGSGVGGRGSGLPAGRSSEEHLARLLRQAPTPVIARVERGALLLDPRTVLEGEEELLLAEVVEVYRTARTGLE